MTRREEVAKLVAILAEAFGRSPSPTTFAAYELGLSGIDVSALKAGVERALRQSKFMPTPAELRELSGELRTEDRAVVAWMTFEEAVTGIGGYKTVSFADPVINATVRSIGGWQHVCTMSVKEFDTYLRKKFIDAYESLSRCGVGEEAAAPLVGEFDRQNALLGFERQEPVIVPCRTGLPAPASRPSLAAGRETPKLAEASTRSTGASQARVEGRAVPS